MFYFLTIHNQTIEEVAYPHGGSSPHGGFDFPARRFSLPRMDYLAPRMEQTPTTLRPLRLKTILQNLLLLLFFVARKLLLHFSTSLRLKILNRAEHEERVEKRGALHVSTRFNALIPWPQTSIRIGTPITIGL